MNIFNIFLIGAALLTLEWLLPFIAGEEYTGSVDPMLILMPGTALFCITNVLASYFAGIGKLRVNLYGSGLCLLLILIFNFVFIPLWGINGAAIASSIGYILVTFYFVAVYLRQSGTRLSELFIPQKNDFRHLYKSIRSSFQL